MAVLRRLRWAGKKSLLWNVAFSSRAQRRDGKEAVSAEMLPVRVPGRNYLPPTAGDHWGVFVVVCLFGPKFPRPGIEPEPEPVEARSLNRWTAREVPLLPVLMPSFYPGPAKAEPQWGEAGGHQGVSTLPGGSHLQPGWGTATCPLLDSPPQGPPTPLIPLSELCSFHLCSNTTFSVISRDYFIESGRTLGWAFPFPAPLCHL